MTPKFPMTLLAQIDDVAVFQTAAFISDDVNSPHLKNGQIESDNQASYGELNLGLHVKDDASKVLNNRMRLLTAINEQIAGISLKTEQPTSIKSLHWVSQVHGKHIYDVDATALGMKPMPADAIISQQQGLGLAIMTADCVPIVLYQPASGQIAAIHAGWQGLACGVIQATVQRFRESGPISAWIGVCISQENYEVGRQVRDQLLAGCVETQSLTVSDIENFDQLYVVNSEADNADKLKLDLPKLAADQLKTTGVTLTGGLPKHCSYADNRYYSYRRQTHLNQPATGRMALVIVRGLSAH
ncbi:polyphenol oxidase family protein [Psychrobacter sp. AOP22-C1-C5]|uniref:polyphenol oxidase family protein n=1 Tax=Psychrobacter sp. AOP22-C1-C5 TaxID=3457716 RepID=UPI004036EDE4